ncbi:TetR/AcrR family transcriptional regulator C-terminal domain-containing protein [Streptomyces sp. NPDC005828]|uniref:TetR/AcrR family transcriptional regulator C-terminal domain-containing protein n=1 Tax=Streptomyces sp. NPDC005828 TaxID=3157071 RepID=UPI0033E71035
MLDGLVEAFFAEVNDRLRTSAEKTSADREIASSGPSWRAELHRIVRAFAATVHTHPEILPVVATRPLSVSVARRPAPVLELTEHILEVLGRAVFDDATTLTIYRAFVAWILGCLLVDKRQTVDNPEEPDLMLRLGLHRMPAAEYPRLRALVPRLAEYDDEQEMIVGLVCLLSRIPEAPLDSFYGGSAG